jgi:PAS domain S-box-containing protein
MSVSLDGDLLMQIFNVTTDAIIVIDDRHTIVACNRGAERMFDYAAADLTGQPLDVLIPDRYRQTHPRHIEQFAHQPETFRRMNQRKDVYCIRRHGAEFPAEAGICRLSMDGRQLFAVILRDVTQDRLHIEHLREQSSQIAVSSERARIARELHDVVTQSLFSVNLMADVLPVLIERDPDRARAHIDDIRQLTRSALAEMRTLLVELRPSALTDSPLSALLRQLGDAFSARAGFKVIVQAEEPGRLPAPVQVAMYRIAQEAFNNIAKHSDASQVLVRVETQTSRALLEIKDNGRGFAQTDVPATHMGLRIMRERAEDIGSELEVKSDPGAGVNVRVIWHKENNNDQRHAGG